ELLAAQFAGRRQKGRGRPRDGWVRGGRLHGGEIFRVETRIKVKGLGKRAGRSEHSHGRGSSKPGHESSPMRGNTNIQLSAAEVPGVAITTPQGAQSAIEVVA